MKSMLEGCLWGSARTSNTYSGQLDGEVTEQNLSGAFPLLSRSRDFVWLQLPLAEVRNSVDDDPWDATTKVYNLDDIPRLVWW